MVTFGCSTNEAAADVFTATEPAGSEAARLRAAIVSGGQLQGLEAARAVISSGFAGVDALLPVGGLRRGSLVEWLVTATGCGPNDDRATGDLEGGSILRKNRGLLVNNE
jgi:hypothetical protein